MRLITRAFWICCLIGLMNVGSFAADITAALPAGWTPDFTMFASSGDNVAVALRSADGNSGRVLQWRAPGIQALTDLPGRVKRVEYSHTGAFVLAHVESVGGWSAYLISSNGSIVWSRPARGISFGFSSDGSAISAWDQGGGADSTKLFVFGLDGGLRRTWDVAPDRPSCALALGSGDMVVFCLHGSVVAMAMGLGAPETVWKYDVPEGDPPIRGAEALSESSLLINQDYGVYKILSTSGQLRYAYDPVSVAAANPGTLATDHMRYDVNTSSSSSQLFLFDGSAVGKTLDLDTLAVTPRVFDVSAPGGYTLLPWIERGTMALLAHNAVRIRRIPQ